jgi:hypothetical protein
MRVAAVAVACACGQALVASAQDAPRPVLVIVDGGASGIDPARLREAIADRLERAVVSPMDVAQPHDIVILAFSPDGSRARLRAESTDGRHLDEELTTTRAVTDGTWVAAGVAERIRPLLEEAESHDDGRASARRRQRSRFCIATWDGTLVARAPSLRDWGFAKWNGELTAGGGPEHGGERSGVRDANSSRRSRPARVTPRVRVRVLDGERASALSAPLP